MQTATAEKTNGKSSGAAALTPLRELDISVLDPSPTQPRRTFDEKADAELADNVREHGVLQAILVRPHPTKKDRFEIVFGERRWRASKKAGRKTIPATIRNLSDVDVLEIQIIENAKRLDIHPLEEADAYHALHTKHGKSVEDIAAKVGRSTATIYARLKFATLPDVARKAFYDGKIDAAKALLIARIPHEDLQRKALAEITKPHYGDELPTLRDAQEIVREKFMLRLADAPFDRGDANLVAGAPACPGCPKRTGAQSELFAEVEKKDDLCTDPKCFKSKSDAAWVKKTEAAKAKGVEVLSEKESKKVFSHGSVTYSSDYVDLAQKTWVDDKEKSNRTIIAGAEVPVVIARDDQGRIHELVAKKDFERARRGVEKERKPTAAEKRAEAKFNADQRRREREREKERLATLDFVTKAEKRQPNDAFWRTLAIAVCRDQSFSADDVFERRGFYGEDDEVNDLAGPVLAAIAKMTGSQARGFIVELLAYHARPEFEALYGARKTTKAKSTQKKKAKAKR